MEQRKGTIQMSKTVPSESVVWRFGKYPGTFYLHNHGKSGKWIPANAYRLPSTFLKVSEIIWDESQGRWYTMDPKAVPIRKLKPVMPLEVREALERDIRAGMSCRALQEQYQITNSELARIKREMFEDWHGK